MALNAIISGYLDSCPYSKDYIARKMLIKPRTLYYKASGKYRFYTDELAALFEVLEVSTEDRKKILAAEFNVDLGA